MHIVVCLKQIIDPEIPPAVFRIDPEKREALQGSANWVTSTFDECALEMALLLKDQDPGVTVTALTFGPKRCDEMLKKALALKCDRAVRIDAPEEAYPDAPRVAEVLARAIGAIDHADLVLCGREAGDWDGAQVGPMLAESLHWPFLTDAHRLENRDGALAVVRNRSGAREVWQVEPPAVVTATNAKENVLRLAKVRDIMMAARQPVTTLSLADLSMDVGAFAESASSSWVEQLFIPQSTSECHMAEGDTPRDQVQDIVAKLKDFGIL